MTTLHIFIMLLITQKLNQYYICSLTEKLNIRQFDEILSIVSGSDRFRLTTTAMGKVHLQIGIIQRNFDKFGIEC